MARMGTAQAMSDIRIPDCRLHRRPPPRLNPSTPQMEADGTFFLRDSARTNECPKSTTKVDGTRERTTGHGHIVGLSSVFFWIIPSPVSEQ